MIQQRLELWLLKWLKVVNDLEDVCIHVPMFAANTRVSTKHSNLKDRSNENFVSLLIVLFNRLLKTVYFCPVQFLHIPFSSWDILIENSTLFAMLDIHEKLLRPRPLAGAGA